MRGDPKMWRLAGLFSAITMEIALCVAIGLYGGEWLDGHYGTKPYLGYAGIAFGIAAASIALVRVVKQARKEMGRKNT